MNRKIILLSIALISVLCASTFLNPASAAPINWVEHASINVEGIQVNVPDYTPNEGVRFSFAHWDSGDHGIRDNLAVYLWAPTYTTGPRFVMGAWISDTDEGIAYNKALMAGSKVTFIQLKPNELQVRGTGDNTGIVRWSVPLEIPAVPDYGMPAITIPPGHITVKSVGDWRTFSGTSNFPWSGFTVKVDWTGHTAEGFFVCSDWHYCGATSGTDPTVRTDLTHLASHT